ncbi:MAG: hypothetical protein CL840_05225 [Crocinitomicaceae bacterium]|jgi:hypothetical protein|nr:hypothetical protein [Crocinitomicaceae bacterium]|tara:strand:+ start:5522 stop:6139 length:618 start_codon:yes stop_codon:yes gene_type:complete
MSKDSKSGQKEKREALFYWAIPLRMYIEEHFDNSPTKLAEHLGLKQQQISRWLTMEAYWIHDDIYIRATRRKPPTWNDEKMGDYELSEERYLNPTFLFKREKVKATPFHKYIERYYDGKAINFKRAMLEKNGLELKQQQVSRYLQYKCMWVGDVKGEGGELFRAVTTESVATKRARVSAGKKRPSYKRLKAMGKTRQQTGVEAQS